MLTNFYNNMMLLTFLKIMRSIKNKIIDTNIEKTKIDFIKIIKKGFHCTVEYTILWDLIKKIYVLKKVNTQKFFTRSYKNENTNRVYFKQETRNRNPKSPVPPKIIKNMLQQNCCYITFMQQHFYCNIKN